MLYNLFMIQDSLAGFKPAIISSVPMEGHANLLRDLKNTLSQKNEYSENADDLKLFFVGTLDTNTGKAEFFEKAEFVENFKTLKLQAHREIIAFNKAANGEK